MCADSPQETELLANDSQTGLRMTDSQRLAGATKVCRNGADGLYLDVDLTGERYTCPECKGTGLVYVFPDTTGVRVRCPHFLTHPKGEGFFKQCCQGRGWTAATDGWAEQANQITLWSDNDGDWRGSVGLLTTPPYTHFGYSEKDDHNRTFQAALMTALCRAVEAHEGWHLMEAPDAG